MARWRWLLVAATTIAIALLLAGSAGGRSDRPSSPTASGPAHERMAVLHPVAPVAAARPVRAATRPLVLLLLLGALAGLVAATVGRPTADSAVASSATVGGRRHQRGPPLLG